MTRSGIAAVAAPFGRDLEAAFELIGRILDRARKRGAGLVVLPEAALGGYIREPMPGEESGPDLPPALDRDGPEIGRLIAMAGDTVICAGYSEAGPHKPYASAVCVSGDGILGHHRKVHLPPAERFAYDAGEDFVAFDTPMGRVGMLLCYDKLFPEASRALALDGAEIVACMASWPADRLRPARRLADDRQTKHFDLTDAARAVENQVVWASANQAGRWGPLRFLASAKVVCPDGTTLASTGTRAGVAVAGIDARRAIDASRAHIDHLADRRPVAYAAPVTKTAMDAAVAG
jgi:N-carbamoylputrescine amidase